MKRLEKLRVPTIAGSLPGLPPLFRLRLAKAMPWLLIVCGALGLIAWLGTVGILKTAYIAAPGLGRTAPGFAAMLFHILVAAAQLLAIAGGCIMLSRRRIGWRLALYSLLAGMAVDIVWFSPAGAVWDMVFAYLLFQVRTYYREA